MSFSKPNPLYLTTTSQQFQKFRDYRKINKKSDKLIPVQRREKLKNLLIVKFMKKYGLKDPETVLEEEVTKFLKGEKLSDNDLQKFDCRIKGIIETNRSQQNLVKNLAITSSIDNNNNNKDSSEPRKLPDINNDILSIVSQVSKASLRSKNSIPAKLGRNMDPSPYLPISSAPNKEVEELSIYSYDSRSKRPQPVINLDGDNWDLIAQYNQRKFEEEKRENMIKDREIKRRIKDDLDIQIRDKLLRTNAELKKNKEFDAVVLKHVENLNKQEKEREQATKSKVLKEKLSRDIQLKDENKRKKIEVMKNKKFEKEIGK